MLLPRLPARARRSSSALLRNGILALGTSRSAVRVAHRYGWRLGARRFVAGERVEDCVAVLTELRGRGLGGYAILLGEGFSDGTRG